MDKAHDICILLDTSRITQVTQQRALLVKSLTLLTFTVELGKSDNRNVEVLGQSLQRLAHSSHLLLSAVEIRTAGRHELQVVNHDHLHVMLTDQTPGLGTQFEDAQTARIIQIDRRIIHGLHPGIQLCPLIGFELSVPQFLTTYLAHITHETPHELCVRHFQREHGDGLAHVDGHLLHHAQYKSRLTHGRTCGDDDQVTVLPAARHLVDTLKSAAQSAETICTRSRLGNHVHHLTDVGIDLLCRLLHVVLREVEDRHLCLVEQVRHVLRLVKSFGQDGAGKGDHLSGQVFLLHDLGTIDDVCRTRHAVGQCHDIGRSARLLQFTLLLQVVRDGKHIDRFLL